MAIDFVCLMFIIIDYFIDKSFKREILKHVVHLHSPHLSVGTTIWVVSVISRIG
jgi:hypothetical protein